MTFRVRTEKRPTTSGLDGGVIHLEDTSGAAHAEIWLALGFNCFGWQVVQNGQRLDLLYADPDLFNNGRPTRSGIPILFPFPNRIRDGRFVWDGKEYQLPCNDSVSRNAIHGFVCRRPWRMVSVGANDQAAWVGAEFSGSRDAPDTLSLWPGDYRIRVTYRLAVDQLEIEAVVDNPGPTRLPFGLGYHPYFRVPLSERGSEGECSLQAAAREFWELRDNLPTRNRLALDGQRDLSAPRSLSGLQLDDVFTGLECPESTAELCMRGQLIDHAANAQLRVLTSPAFRELVLFTPPHRQAVCIEPYTCTTDAINLQQQGVDAGWLVLEPGEQWTGRVAMQYQPGLEGIAAAGH